MASTQTDAIEMEVRCEASPEVVFAYLTDPAKMVRWMGIEADLDPRPGGIYKVSVTPGDIARGEFVEVVPYSKVVYTWGWENPAAGLPPGASRVEITLEPLGSSTIIRLRHSGLTPEQREAHGEGWTHFTERLQLVTAGRDPGPDPWAAGS